ncbi:hypothetical protein GX50_02470 [[Emmonsia] crescens]|uniref:Scytalone dehydratase-like protein Arp1 N-terminal domain-containing protein n=1 Tax=[Emmonsia] crescens TaxID=73230 RepID=A0A2B7ZNU3_9EURO|nr:hypothetical protein GX50_02470 [Emmonsia crescens]
MAQIKECTGSGEKIFSMEGARYIAPCSDTDAILSSPDEFSLVTVFTALVTPETKITADWVREKVHAYKNTDDVFHEAFLAGVF